VIVLSANGGVGKTTVAAVLADLFAQIRGDAVIVVDASPRAGTLVDRLCPERRVGASVTHVLAAASCLGTYAAFRLHAQQAVGGRLLVVASDVDPDLSEALTPQDIHRLSTVTASHFNLVVWDTCGGLRAPAVEGLLSIADQLVIVTSPAVDRIRGTEKMLQLLVERGHLELVRRAVLVINAAGGRELPAAERSGLGRRFSGSCGKLIHLPDDPHLSEGGVISRGALLPRTRQALIELAAAVAGQWRSQPRCERGNNDTSELVAAN
jgi:MinD-like ATPase involved in chromosome partitioning or flagellar assembly